MPDYRLYTHNSFYLVWPPSKSNTFFERILDTRPNSCKMSIDRMKWPTTKQRFTKPRNSLRRVPERVEIFPAVSLAGKAGRRRGPFGRLSLKCYHWNDVRYDQLKSQGFYGKITGFFRITSAAISDVSRRQIRMAYRHLVSSGTNEIYFWLWARLWSPKRPLAYRKVAR